MTTTNETDRRRMLHYLQSLERTGITHVPRCSAEVVAELTAAASQVASSSANRSVSSPSPVHQVDSIAPVTSHATREAIEELSRGVPSGVAVRTEGYADSRSKAASSPSTSPPPSTPATRPIRSTSSDLGPPLDAEFRIETARLSREEKIAALAELNKLVVPCVRCQELANARTQTVFGSGDADARLVFVGEAPGADEDRLGQPFVGRAGQKLTEIIERGMKISRDQVYICNVLKCRPPGNRTPLPDEIANCRGFLERQLEIIRPEYICCLGTTASKTLLNTTLSMGRLRGRLHKYAEIPVVCTYHPSYILKYPEYRKEVWEDIQFLMREMGMLQG